MHLTYSVVLSMFACLVSVTVSVLSWRRREARGALPIVVFTAATAIWTAGNGLQVASTTISAKLFWVSVEYVGTAVVPLAWFAFACEYTDNREWLSRRALVALAVPSALTLVLAWTNEYHHLVRTSAELVTVNGTVVLRRTFGPAFFAGTVYANIVNGVGTVLLLRGLVRSQDLFQKQTVAVLAGTTVPWAASGLYYNGFLSVQPEVFFAVTGVAFAYAISRYELLKVAPIGRRTVVEEIDDPVLVLDAKDRIVDANPAARRVFGWARAADPIGRPLAAVRDSHPSVLDAYELGDQSEKIAVESDDGVHRYFDVQRSSLSDRGRSVSGSVLVLNDVTAHKRYEEHLERQNEYLEHVAQNLAHDLRNPLNVAQGHLEFARTADDDSAHLDKVEGAHQRMDDIVDEILDMANGEVPVQLDHLSVEGVARNAWENVETYDATLAFDGTELSVRADQRQLASVFENLFRNAIENAGHDAAVRVGSLGSDGDNGVASLAPQSGFYVADDGPGIPERERERVFERGYTTREDGTGVGLAFVRDVIERHEWEVCVAESDAGGTRVEVREVTVAPT
ncbi:sensor histidine kinase [Halorussus pelagicus]|uniref:sensor histidine kinase n=1 Tax=Halorussus pelagicus TaxID=2505977 RepID=UPI000FFCB88A|nr:histidine kinase N-terminal 7TM domain-containing protein [Halorussus pelagicus]